MLVSFDLENTDIMARFHRLKVIDVREETNDCTSIELEVPRGLRKEFRYGAGQHIIFKKDFDGEDIRRTYSLCSDPFSREWRVCVKQIPEGKFSTFVHDELKIGDFLIASSPTGKFGTDVQLEPENQRNFLFIAAGSGITPIIAMVKMVLEQEPLAKCQLLYVNRGVQSIVFREELEQLKNRFLDRFELYNILTRQKREVELLNGRLDGEKLRELSKTLINLDDIDHVFMCGPEAMTFEIRDELVELGVEKRKIHYELFVTGLSEEDKKRAAAALESRFEGGTKVTVIEGGTETHLVMKESDPYEVVLEAALAAGADVPFACKDGMCSTCKCKVEEGEVVMKKNYALEKDDLEQGYVLSCQSVPTTKTLRVNYDV